MDGVAGVGGASATDAMLVRNAEADTDKSVMLLKKSLTGEQDLVNKLLPTPASTNKLDITA